MPDYVSEPMRRLAVIEQSSGRVCAVVEVSEDIDYGSICMTLNILNDNHHCAYQHIDDEPFDGRVGYAVHVVGNDVPFEPDELGISRPQGDDLDLVARVRASPLEGRVVCTSKPYNP